MNTKLYVNHLDTTTTYLELMELFSPYGPVAEVNLPMDRASGRPRGFGLVTMTTPEGARAAIAAIHGKEIGAQHVTVSEAGPPGARAVVNNGGHTPRRSVRQLY